MGEIKKILVIPHIEVHNANALSSPFTIGFPAMTAWLGAAHALQRKLNDKGFSVTFDGVGVVSHDVDLQTYKGRNDFVSSVIGTGNPLDKSGSRQAFIEEARCHLDVSVIIEFSGIDKETEADFLNHLSHALHAQMKIAGGDIQSFQPLVTYLVEAGNDTDIAKLTRRLMPGHVLIERRDLMSDAMEQGQDAIEALIDYLAIHHHCDRDEDGKVTWHSSRKTPPAKSAGWLVPIATGFHGITDIGKADNQRDPEVPHRFVESVVTLCEFKMPYRFHSVEDLLWRYHFDESNRLYLCQQGQQNQPIQPTSESEFD